MLIKALSDAIRRHDLIDRDRPLVVGVSGGTDSLALLHGLLALGYDNLHVATLDHGLRQEAGAQDAAFVQATAQAWGVPVSVGRAQLNPAQPGIEAVARHARYTFFAEVAAQAGAQQIAVAHHADDQAETILLNIVRGAGLNGLSGMAFKAPVPYAPHLTLIRPLLAVHRADIEAYCRENGLKPRRDATNDDLTFQRNFVRHHIMPHLRTLNPRASEAINRLGAHARAEDDYLQAELRRLTNGHTQHTAQAVRLDLKVYRSLHPVLQRRFILSAARHLNPSAELTQQQIESALPIVQDGVTGTVALLCQGLRLRVDYDWLIVEGGKPTDAHILAPGETVRLRPDGLATLASGWRVGVVAHPPEGAHCARLCLPPSAEMLMRGRAAGDRWTPANLNGRHQTLRKWMIDRKIPRHLRGTLPLLIVDGSIAAVFSGEKWVISHDYSAPCHAPIPCDWVYVCLQRS